MPFSIARNTCTLESGQLTDPARADRTGYHRVTSHRELERESERRSVDVTKAEQKEGYVSVFPNKRGE